MDDEKTLPPTILVVFGITGDLSHRYLLPALAAVTGAGKLPTDFRIVGVSRRNVEPEDVFKGDEECLKPHSEMLQMDLESPASYENLKARITNLRNDFGTDPEVIYYLSVPPNGVLHIIRNLGETGLNAPQAKLLLEKPFGINLQSAQALIAEIHKHFPEDQVFRIDHYLAKAMAQNIVVFLGSNTLIRDVWSNRFIEAIEIDVSEQIGIEGRVNFYESTGALRDIVQSHLLQLAALILMEPCSNIFDFDELPKRRLAALRNIRSKPDTAIRGQYEGYKQEVNNPDSKTETLVSLVVESSDPRWQGVPISLTTGKSLKERLTEVRVYFKKGEFSEENLLVLRVQPREGIELHLWIKQPGYERRLQKLPLEFNYTEHFERLPQAYEQILIDIMQSNHSLFASSDEVLASWEILEPIQEQWAKNARDLVTYKSGSTIEEILQLANSKTSSYNK